MTQSQTHPRSQAGPATETGASCTRCGAWGWGAAFLAVTAFGLFFGALAWTGRSEANRDGAEPGDTGSQVSLTGNGVSEAPDPLAPLNAGGEAAAGGVVWQESYAAALAEADQQGKPVLIRFTASWCMPCQVMDATVWPDEEVRRTLADRAIPVKIDLDEDDHLEVIRRYGVRAIPTLLLVDASGEVLARGGFMSAEALVEFLREA